MSIYNGWTNWDTWAAHLNISNDEYFYHVAKRADNPRQLQAIFLSNIELCYDNIDMELVDWNEVLEALKE